MAFFDKLNKDDLLAKAKKAGDSMKNSLSQAQAAIEEKKEQSRLAKLPQEGGLKRYEVTYRGGHPDYPMSKEINKYPYIIMDVNDIREVCKSQVQIWQQTLLVSGVFREYSRSK